MTWKNTTFLELYMKKTATQEKKIVAPIVFTIINELSLIKNPYLSHNNVDSKPLTKGNAEISPVLLLLTIFLAVSLENIIKRNLFNVIKYTYSPVENCNIAQTEAEVASILLNCILLCFSLL